MKVRLTRSDATRIKADLVVCFAYEDDREPRGIASSELRKQLAERMASERFRGTATDRLVWNANGRFACSRFVVLGLGSESTVAGRAIRMGAARAATAAHVLGASKLALRLPDDAVDPAAEVRAAVEGVRMGDYRFEKYIKDRNRHTPHIAAVDVMVDRIQVSTRRAVERGDVAASAVCLARDLVNEPPSRMNPTAMAREARRAARSSGLRCTILGEPELRKLGMRSLMAVARGSSEPPRVAHLVYRPARGVKRRAGRVVLVGKGVTFDSGGLNLKPGPFMTHMKSDMGGSAAVLGAMTALRDLECPFEVHGLLGLVENMTGQNAFKPGDILDTYDGKTVEVGNTDAEGRLVLCDLLAYAADKLKPAALIDVATLTGACVVALGQRATGVFSRHEELSGAVIEASRLAGEEFWPLPLYEEYLEPMQKGPADLHNVGGRYGGAITAALFLGEFVPRDVAWAHLDIAGPAFTETDLPEARTGGTGAGVRTLLRWLEAR